MQTQLQLNTVSHTKSHLPSFLTGFRLDCVLFKVELFRDVAVVESLEVHDVGSA